MLFHYLYRSAQRIGIVVKRINTPLSFSKVEQVKHFFVAVIESSSKSHLNFLAELDFLNIGEVEIDENPFVEFWTVRKIFRFDIEVKDL